ncbi:MAG: VWA domain-containing protein [Myxococcales bacterium]|nr:MAG: VWA domain-containing protein [Myxococcales bacterium]
MLEQRDYTLIIDQSGSMGIGDVGNGQTRWQAVQESTLALATKCEQLDPDGLTVYLFSTSFRRHDNVTSSRVAELFRGATPDGSTNLAAVLRDAFDGYFQRKAAGQSKPQGETILVVTDGSPNDQDEVIDVIVAATHRMEKDEELAVLFVQIGRDAGARDFLKRLDDDLVGPQKTGFFQKLFGGSKKTARFDICDTISFDEMEDKPLTKVLLDAIQD